MKRYFKYVVFLNNPYPIISLCISKFITNSQEIDPAVLEALLSKKDKKEKKAKKLTPEQADAKRRKMWIAIAKKEIPRVSFFFQKHTIFIF